MPAFSGNLRNITPPAADVPPPKRTAISQKKFELVRPTVPREGRGVVHTHTIATSTEPDDLPGTLATIQSRLAAWH
ncbi:hypothetical protein AC578_10217 [Pseudocercospora eumusae]|uniref:Uncharacterized protein n=1 Tax=Pseudocercospora eumusae TaxID=321146 RepID=A0A139HYM0_9PEZI|nr:hypothetical protein AC578_10217 [Pseudocercospora eumusae]